MSDKGLFDKGFYGCHKVFSTFEFVSELVERFCNDGVENNVGSCDRERGTEHSELKLVAGERKRRSTVSVRSILLEFRQRTYADFVIASCALRISSAFGNCGEDTVEFLAEEYGYYSGGSFVSTETVVVARACYADSEQILIIVYGFEHGYEEEQKLCVIFGSVARL